MTSHDGYHFRLSTPLQHCIALLLFFVLAALFLAPALPGNRVLLPTDMLSHMSPWAEMSTSDPSPGTTTAPWNPLLWDAMAQFYPWRAFAAHWMRQGVIPLWDPHQFCGTPFLANSQSAVLYPLHFLLLYLPSGLHPARGMVLLAWAHMTLAGFLTYLFLCSLRLHAFASWLGGVTFMLSGFVVTWLELPSFLTVACWLPLLLLSLHLLIQHPSLARVAAVSGAVGLLLLGGHLQIAFYCLLGTAVFVIVRLLSPAARGRRSTVLLLVLLGIGLGGMLAAPQLLPAVELSRSSHRVTLTSMEGYRAYVGSAMPAWQLIRLFLPGFYGNPSRGGYLAGSPADYTEFAGYIGGVGLLLATVALLAWKRRAWETLTAGLIAAFALLLALGTPLNILFYFGIPGFSQSGSPARVLVLFCFAGAWLVALGVEALVPAFSQRQGEGSDELAAAADRPTGQPGLSLSGVTLAIWLGLLGAALWAAQRFVASRGADFATMLGSSVFPLAQGVLFALLACGLSVGLAQLQGRGSVSPALAYFLGRGVLCTLVLGELWIAGAGFNPVGPLASVYPRTPLLETLSSTPIGQTGRLLPVNRRWNLYQHPNAVLPPNSALALGFADPQGYDSLFLGSYKGLSNLIAGPGTDSAPPENGNMLFVSNLSSPLLPLLAADRVLVRAGTAVERQEQSAAGRRSEVTVPQAWPLLAEHGGLQVRRVREALPRAFLAPDWRAASEARVPDELMSLASTRQLGAIALLTGKRARGERGGTGGAAALREVGPNEIQVTMGERTEPGTLVVLDNAAPGWRAREAASGRRLPLYQAHLTFRGVPLAAGTHSVQMRYEPVTFRLGLYLAAVATAALMTLVVAGWRRGWIPA